MAVTTPVATIPSLAVIIPIESIFLTSSYVAIPATLKLPESTRFVPVVFSANVDASPPPTAVLAIPTHLAPS
mgnify:CR=1 FL=1